MSNLFVLFCFFLFSPTKSQFDDSTVGKALNQGGEANAVLGLDFSRGSDLSSANSSTVGNDLQKTFNRTDLNRLRNALQTIRQKWSTKLRQMPARVWPPTDGNAAQDEQKPVRTKVRARVKEDGDTLHQINKKAGLNDYLYQGDMILTNDQISTILESQDSSIPSNSIIDRQKRQAYRDRYYPSTTWGTSVYYYYDFTATPKIIKAFEAAVEFWQNVTCINIYKSQTAINRIRVFKGQGCYSYVGRVTGVQDLSLGKGCEEFGTAAHELGHALGFFHTQSRFDRDNYISINYANIEPDYMEQFDKESSSTNYNYEMPYDYGSIMQYGSTSASSNDQPTMIAKDPEYQDTMGSDFVSFYDISMMNEHYKCKELCSSSSFSTQCQNGGFPNPRNCQVCICPSGYGGNFCESRPAGCGLDVEASEEWKSIANTIGDGLPVLRDQHVFCNYWIKAPEGKAIEIRINTLQSITIDGCIFGGIEIKANKDQKLTGYRYCSPQDQNTTIRTTKNIAPIIIYNRYASTRVILDYRLVNPSKIPDQATTVQPIVNSCQDRHPNCDAYAWNGFCVNPFYSIHVRRYYCALTCSLCWTFLTF